MAAETPVEFQSLVERLHAGDQTAATEIFVQYSSRLVALANDRLDSLLRQKLDPEDVVESVFLSLLGHQAAGELVLNDLDHLWALLVTMTLRKCGGKLDHFRAARRDVRREVPQGEQAESLLSCAAIAREPTPEEAAVLSELVERLLHDLPERDREIVRLSLQNFTAAEIKQTLGCSERTVFRVLERIKTRLRNQARPSNRD